MANLLNVDTSSAFNTSTVVSVGAAVTHVLGFNTEGPTWTAQIAVNTWNVDSSAVQSWNFFLTGRNGTMVKVHPIVTNALTNKGSAPTAAGHIQVVISPAGASASNLRYRYISTS